MRNTHTPPIAKPHRIAMYAMVAVLSITGSPGTSLANQECEHLNAKAWEHSEKIQEKCSNIMSFETQTIPEPASLPLIAAGLLVFIGIKYRRNRS